MRTEERRPPSPWDASVMIGRLLRGLLPEVQITVLRLIHERKPHAAQFVLRHHDRGLKEAEHIVTEIVRIQVQSGTTGWE